MDAGTHLHREPDVDFLDPTSPPASAPRCRGGPTYREAQLCMEMIADTGRLAVARHRSNSIPALDVRNRTAELARGPGREPVRQEHAFSVSKEPAARARPPAITGPR